MSKRVTPALPPPGRARELALKELRRAEALRANLRRRKEQGRARDADDADDAAPGADPQAIDTSGTDTSAEPPTEADPR